MTGTEKYSGTYDDFVEALGYPRNKRGFQIHSERARNVGDIAFCYPPNPDADPPSMSGMYYFYHTMARIFRENLVSKMGDLVNLRVYHVNLLYYCHPSRQRKIDGCDYIYREIKRSVEGRMTPNYCAFVQRFLNARVPPEMMRG